MDARLFEAAHGGNIEYLRQLLAENPFILNITLLSAENPLNIAADMGHVDFVKEIIRLKPVFAREVNQEGFSPMHVAAANGHVEIVKELLKVDIELCRIEARQKMTPFHHATIRGRAEVISAMLLDCPDCIEDQTDQRENALHLAVRNNRFEAIKILVGWIRETNKEYLLNMKDEQGNTVLHLASWKKQRQVIEILLGSETISSGSLEVNAVNHSGLTALDVILIFPSEAGDREIVEILRNAGATRARDIIQSTIPSNQTSTDNSSMPERCQSNLNNLVEYFKFKKGRDSPSEARGTLLVIAVLVATATFQVGINPPGGVWQDTNIPDQKNSTSSNNAHIAGAAWRIQDRAESQECLADIFSQGKKLSARQKSTILHPEANRRLEMHQKEKSYEPKTISENEALSKALQPLIDMGHLDSQIGNISPALNLNSRVLTRPLFKTNLFLPTEELHTLTMDGRLFEAARNGDVDYLQQLLAENPFSLDNTSLLFSENPLHIASNEGHLDFVKEILKLKPEFAKEINQDGFSPMHMAAAKGHVAIVMELMKVDHNLCRLKGIEERTPLHYATIKDRVEVIVAMLLGCPDCIELATVRSDTALHLAIKNNLLEATQILVDQIQEMNKEDVLNMKDQQGNTVLHLATWKKQYQVIELLLGTRNTSPGSLEVNAINHSGLTPLDMLLTSPSEAGDREIIEILLGAGAMKSRDITLSAISSNQNHTDTSKTTETHQSRPNNLVEYFNFLKGRDPPGEARGTLLVIAVLVATATFQVGVSPPGGVWQDNNIADQSNSTSSYPKHFAGQSILGTIDGVAFAVFVLFKGFLYLFA
ncbi:unnamed protein product [Dovyalis caffra]|uniref:PGG domain-containing protein n=1 Tax=Dovyalis caffra TaxID=77055 RepID=A0AAV1RJI9_9ROSI|nr:unnamed protein product [Dovyalis caffra]